jgi:hypothetical protein
LFSTGLESVAVTSGFKSFTGGVVAALEGDMRNLFDDVFLLSDVASLAGDDGGVVKLMVAKEPFFILVGTSLTAPAVGKFISLLLN